MTSLSDKVFYENTDEGFPIFVKDIKDMNSKIDWNPNSFLDTKDVAEAVEDCIKEINKSRSKDLSDRYVVGIEAGLTLAIQIINKRFGDLKGR